MSSYLGSVYLAGPISGLSYDEARNDWRKLFFDLVGHEIAVLSPMRQQGYLQEVTEMGSVTQNSGHYFDKEKAIVSKDFLDVKRCDIVVVNLIGSKKVSIGTMIEIGWANALGKPVVLIIEEDATNNPHHHTFVYELASFRVSNVEESISLIKGLLVPGI